MKYSWSIEETSFLGILYLFFMYALAKSPWVLQCLSAFLQLQIKVSGIKLRAYSQIFLLSEEYMT